MRRDRFTITGGLLGLTLLAWPLTGTAQEPPAAQSGPGEKAGNVLDAAGRRIKRGFQEAETAVQNGWDRTKAAVNNMGIESRIYGRLHWDKALTDAPIQLETQAGGVVILRGSVADAAAKLKAQTLASETVGVTRVVNELAVTSASATAPAVTTP